MKYYSILIEFRNFETNMVSKRKRNYQLSNVTTRKGMNFEIWKGSDPWRSQKIKGRLKSD